MKVFKSEFDGAYGGGCIIVAANSEQEALETAFKNDCYEYHGWDYYIGQAVPAYNNVTPFVEMPGLTYEGSVPTILIYNIYQE